MMDMKLLYVQVGYMGAYHKNKITRMHIYGADWYLWVECVEVGFYVVRARM